MNRSLYGHTAIFPCAVRVLPSCLFLHTYAILVMQWGMQEENMNAFTKLIQEDMKPALGVTEPGANVKFRDV